MCVTVWQHRSIGFSEPRRLSCNQFSLATKRYRMQLNLNIEGERHGARPRPVDADRRGCLAGPDPGLGAEDRNVGPFQRLLALLAAG